MSLALTKKKISGPLPIKEQTVADFFKFIWQNTQTGIDPTCYIVIGHPDMLSILFIFCSLKFTRGDGAVDGGHKGGDRGGKNQQRAFV